MACVARRVRPRTRASSRPCCARSGSEALEQAAKLGVTLSSEAQKLAQEHAGERAMSYAEALSDTRSAELLALRERALSEPLQAELLAELLSRGAHRELVLGCRALAELTPEQAGELFAKVALRNDPAAVDALLSLLSPGEETAGPGGGGARARAPARPARHRGRDREPGARGRPRLATIRAGARPLWRGQLPCRDARAARAARGRPAYRAGVCPAVLSRCARAGARQGAFGGLRRGRARGAGARAAS